MIVSATVSDRPGFTSVANAELAAITFEVAVSDGDVVLIDDQTPISQILSGLDEDVIVHLDVRRASRLDAVSDAVMHELERRDRAMMVSVDDENLMPAPVDRPVPYGLRIASRGSMLIEPRLRASEANFVVSNMGHFDAAKLVAATLDIPLVVTSNGQASDENRVFADDHETFMMISKDFAGALIRWRWSNSQETA